MIHRPTVLVLGAGASAPYGFPCGAELRRLIVENVARPNHEYNKALREAGFGPTTINEFVAAFDGSRQESIDAFLGTREDLHQVGTAAIERQS